MNFKKIKGKITGEITSEYVSSVYKSQSIEHLIQISKTLFTNIASLILPEIRLEYLPLELDQLESTHDSQASIESTFQDKIARKVDHLKAVLETTTKDLTQRAANLTNQKILSFQMMKEL